MIIKQVLNPSNKYGRQHGFTLMELVVVIAILGLAAALVLPLLPSTDAAALKDSARRLSTVVRYLGERSVTTKTVYRMTVDLGESSVTVKKMENGEEKAPDDTFFSRKILDNRVTIEDIEVPRLGKLSEGSVNVDFGVSGLGEFLVIHLKGADGGQFTITALPYGGRVELLEGYQEPMQ